MAGKFISIEGQDGAGKSTNLAFVEQFLAQKGLTVHTTREPGGTELGELLRQTLLYQNQVACSDLTELLLMFAARAQHIDEVIKPKLAQGVWVVSDRFTDASYAYQGAGRGLDVGTIATLEKLVQQGLKPDLTLLLDVPLEVAKSRGAVNQEDRFERQRDEFKLRVRGYYQSLCQSEPERVKLIDASQSVAQVQCAIAGQLDRLLNQPNRHDG